MLDPSAIWIRNYYCCLPPCIHCNWNYTIRDEVLITHNNLLVALVLVALVLAVVLVPIEQDTSRVSHQITSYMYYVLLVWIEPSYHHRCLTIQYLKANQCPPHLKRCCWVDAYQKSRSPPPQVTPSGDNFMWVVVSHQIFVKRRRDVNESNVHFVHANKINMSPLRCVIL